MNTIRLRPYSTIEDIKHTLDMLEFYDFAQFDYELWKKSDEEFEFMGNDDLTDREKLIKNHTDDFIGSMRDLINSLRKDLLL